MDCPQEQGSQVKDSNQVLVDVCCASYYIFFYCLIQTLWLRQPCFHVQFLLALGLFEVTALAPFISAKLIPGGPSIKILDLLETIWGSTLTVTGYYSHQILQCYFGFMQSLKCILARPVGLGFFTTSQ